MKAISLWEPWASLIRTGAKTWETRSWWTSHRGKLLICAAKGGLSKSNLRSILMQQPFQAGLAPLIGKPLNLESNAPTQFPLVEIENLNFGNAVAVVKLIDVNQTNRLTLEEIGTDLPFGDFSPGRYAWKLQLIKAITPFPVQGKQGFFDVSFSLD